MLYLNGLMDIVESDVILLAKTVDGADNMEHKVWQSRNQLIYGWIKTTIGATGYQLIQKCTTTQARVEREPAPTMPMLAKGIRDKFGYMRKRPDQIMHDYLNNIKFFYDILVNIGRTIDNTDIINTSIDGLGAEYDSFVSSLHIRDSTNFT